MSFIPNLIYCLSVLDLTNRAQLQFLRFKIVEEGTNLFEDHLVEHGDCDCIDIERKLALYNHFIQFIDRLLIR